MVLIPIQDRESYLKYKQQQYFTPMKAVQQQEELIEKWEPAAEVWSLKHGSKVMGMVAAMSSITINSIFRQKLKLHKHGLTFTTICAITGPGLLTAAFYEYGIKSSILLYEHQCPLCYELKAALLLTCTGILFPLVLLPTVNLGIAANFGLRVPYITEAREIGKFWWSVVKPATTQVSTLFALNSIVASVITYKQLLSMETVAKVLLEIEKLYEREQNEKLDALSNFISN